jgi:hypothetical protein
MGFDAVQHSMVPGFWYATYHTTWGFLFLWKSGWRIFGIQVMFVPDALSLEIL